MLWPNFLDKPRDRENFGPLELSGSLPTHAPCRLAYIFKNIFDQVRHSGQYTVYLTTIYSISLCQINQAM